MKPLIRTKFLVLHQTAKALYNSSNLYRDEVEDALKRFRNLDFGDVSNQDLNDNTDTLANESGMLVGRYKTAFGGFTNVIHNMDFGKTIVTLVLVPVKCSHFGF